MKEDRINVSIDLDKIKYPNTGLHTFSLQLIAALNRVKEADIALSYWLPRKITNIPVTPQKTLQWWHRILPLPIKQNEVFHQIFQLGKYMPTSGHKTILTIHDLNFLYEKSDNKAAKLAKKVQRNIDRSQRLVAISEYARQDIIKHMRVDHRQIDVIYNGCSFFDGEPTENPNYKPQAPFLLTIGTVLPKKNFHVLPILLRDNNMELIIAGNCSAYQEHIMAEAATYGVADRVKIIGGVSEADKDWYYRNCLAFVFPSIAEGFGLPVIEALSHGKPVFISRHTSLPEIGKEYCYYFNYEFNREQMVAEFNQGMEHFPTRDTQSLIDYAKSYSWDKTAQEYCQIYKELSKKK